MLLVDAHEPEPAYRRENRRARADDDARVATRDAQALVPSLGLRQPGMEQRDGVAEPRAEATDRLRRERDLRHEHDRAEAALERGRARLQVDLGLAAAGRAVEEEVRSRPSVERADDARDGVPLGRRQNGRLGLSCERLARAGLLAFAARRPLHRRDERQGARRRRAVVVRNPEGELDQRRWQLVDDALDRRDLDARRCRDAELDDEPAPLCVPEAHLDDRADTRVLRHLVGERPRDRARGDQGIHGSESYPSRLDAACDEHEVGGEAEEEPEQDSPGDHRLRARTAEHVQELDHDVEDRASRKGEEHD